MAKLTDPGVRRLLTEPNHAVISTHNADGTIHSSVIWIALEGDDAVSINSAVGRRWPANVQRDPNVTLVVYDQNNPYEYVRITGIADAGTTEGADEHIDALSEKYTGNPEYQFRKPGEQRIKFVVRPAKVFHRTAG
jgi:PPOX class probable F420-dependent enzyme